VPVVRVSVSVPSNDLGSSELCERGYAVGKLLIPKMLFVLNCQERLRNFD